MNPLRLSAYIIIEKLDNSDQYLLVHGYTGAIDICSQEVVDYLKANRASLDNQSLSTLTDETWNLLLTRGYVTTKTVDEEITYMKHIASILHEKEKKLKHSFGFLVSYDCNFRCPYCYEAQISGGGASWSKKTFTKQRVDHVFKAIENIEPRRELHHDSLLLYGGEPLLEENKEIVSYIVQEGKKRGYNYYAITNGYDLDQYEDLLGEDMIKGLQITLDGARDTHDKRRIHYRDVRSFDKIIKNIGMALVKGVAVSVRINTDEENIDSIPQLKTIFDDIGYTKYNKFKYYCAMLIDYQADNQSCSSNKEMKYLNRRDLYKKYDGQQDVVSEDQNTTMLLYAAMKRNKKPDLKSAFCSAQNNAAIFDPMGKIYGCWESVGTQEAIIGEYSSEVNWTPVREKWRSRNTGILSRCSTCKYSLFCRGGCITLLLKQGLNFEDSFCNDYPYIFHVAANKAYTRYISDVEIF